MKISWRTKTGSVITDVYFDSKKNPKKSIVLAYGLLSTPPRKDSAIVGKLIDKGFMVWCPNYIGTFASDGICTFENAVETVCRTIRLIKKGTCVELHENKRVKWKTSEIILAGGSFGGSVALVAGAKLKCINKIISISAPTDYSSLWKSRGRKRREFISIWRRSWANVWRSTETYWKSFSDGSLDLNAMNYIDELKEKSVMIIHDKGDNVVPLSHATHLYQTIKSGKGKHALLLTNHNEHLGIGHMADKRIFSTIMKWIGTVG